MVTISQGYLMALMIVIDAIYGYINNTYETNGQYNNLYKIFRMLMI